MIELIDVYKAFGSKQVLNGFTLHVERGETFVIIGRNGIGKTVTFKHIMGLMKPDRGQVIVEGQDITKLRGRALIAERDKFGMVFQGCALLNWLTVAQNVALPLRERTRLSKREIQKKVDEKLGLMGLPRVSVNHRSCLLSVVEGPPMAMIRRGGGEVNRGEWDWGEHCS